MLLQEHIQQIPYFEMSDAQLAQLTLAGDQTAFTGLVKRYYTQLFNFACHFLADYDQACDVVQQVFIQLYNSLSTLDKDEPFKSWLFQVTRYCCIDELRRRRRHALPFSWIEPEESTDETLTLEHIPDASPSLDELMEQQDLRRTLQEAIANLPPRFRAVVTLRYAGQLKFAEIGKVLNMPEPTAKTYFARAKVLLRKTLSQSSIRET
ncbi:MAG: RNA polymerase sigma factor [Ktedonobacteraceae bacterium]|nr:RNA polymerase sigma factor [Ktedonobacteraceae bacterium]